MSDQTYKHKTCSRCSRRRRTTSFNKGSGRDGLRSECRDCRRAADSEYIWRPEIREWRRETAELWWIDNGDKRNERRRRERAEQAAA